MKTELSERIIMFRIWSGTGVTVGDISCAFSKNEISVANLMENPRTRIIQPDCLTPITRGDVELFKVHISAPSKCLVFDDGVMISIGGDAESTVEIRYTSDADWGESGAKLFMNSPARLKADPATGFTFSPPIPEPIIICRPEHQ